ncbi:hypothetical protein MLD38_000707 [Melastoma candidum]|uniref:Uncharacterized protein n=1 Tax=Melastoma candidum TaxID=119954 RepID=A0ACB9SCJ7_9MYRT|nr:hypothetical protein MLD38_000707 [Melastoma candidum]
MDKMTIKQNRRLRSCLLLLISSLVLGSSVLASAHEVDVRDDVLGWVKNDTRRFLNAVIRVGDLNRTIEFYMECFGMKLLSSKDFPEEKYTKAIVGFGPQASHFVIELVYHYGVKSYDLGTAFGHFGIVAEDIYPIVERVRQHGGKITREPGTMGGGSQVFAFVEDTNGYSFELLQKGPTPEPLSHVMLQVTDLNRSVSFYEKALGMNVLQSYDSPTDGFAIAMMGYGSDLNKTVAVELKYNYNITRYTPGNVYVHLAIGTDDVYRSAAAVALVAEEIGGRIIRPPGLYRRHVQSFSFVDPEGRKTVLVDNKDYLRSIQG